jgi:hypothetical protein
MLKLKYSICLSDIPIGNERLISVSLSGIFRERIRGENQPLRHFHRSFVIVPHGSGYLIVNETLFITNPTSLEAKQAFCEEVKTAQPIGNKPKFNFHLRI